MNDTEVDFRVLGGRLWDGKLTIVFSMLLLAGIAFAYSTFATKIYRSEALVQPRSEMHGLAGLGGFAAGLGGGMDLGPLLGGSAGGDRPVAIATLRSRVLIERFIQDNGLLPKLFPRSWDPETKQWKSNVDVPPTVWQGYNKFTQNILAITEDKRTGLVTVTIDWIDPSEAQQWAGELIARANSLMRERAIREAEANLAYLQEQAKTRAQVEMQHAIYELMEAELKKLMLAKGGEEFAFRTIDPAVVPREWNRPRRLRLTVIGLLAGLTIGILAVLWRRS